MVRLLHLRAGGRPRPQRGVLPRGFTPHRCPDPLRNDGCRIHRPPARRDHLRPRRRPHRTQEDAHHHAAADGLGDLRHGPAPGLDGLGCRGADPASRAATAAGSRRRRRVGRCRPDRRRARPAEEEGAVRLVRADGFADRPGAGDHGHDGGHVDLRHGSGAGMGLAHPLPRVDRPHPHRLRDPVEGRREPPSSRPSRSARRLARSRWSACSASSCRICWSASARSRPSS